MRGLTQLAECDKRTVSRYLVELRDEHDAPWIYERAKNRYRFTVPWSLPDAPISEGELLVFFLAERVLKQTGRTDEAEILESALGKLATRLPKTVSVNLATFGQSFSFENAPAVRSEAKYLQQFASATAKQETLEIVYFTKRSNTEKTRRVDPLHVAERMGDWYVYAFDHLSRQMRDFHIGRVRSIKQTNQFFERPKDWDREKYVNSGYMMFRGGRLVTVKLLFDPAQAPYIAERTEFHNGETREFLPDGSLRLSFRVGSKALEGVARSFLQYAGSITFESPPKLRKIVMEKLIRSIEMNTLEEKRDGPK
jgi:predicted DNA-binding transcriptional regulator YafY